MGPVIGVAPLTVVRLDGGRRTNLHAGGLVPDDADPEDVARLIAEGYLEELAETPDPDPQDLTALSALAGAVMLPPGGTSAEDDDQADVAALLKGTVDEVLDAVGDDVDLAVVVLAAEQQGRGRKGVIDGLQEAIDAAADSGE